MLDCLLVGLGGFLGCVARYVCARIPIFQSFAPLKTLLINCLGSFLLSFVMATAARRATITPRLLLMLTTGLCGGFTTFSTFAFEYGSLFSQGRPGAASLYLLSSILGGLLFFFLGQLIG